MSSWTKHGNFVAGAMSASSLDKPHHTLIESTFCFSKKGHLLKNPLQTNEYHGQILCVNYVNFSLHKLKSIWELMGQNKSIISEVLPFPYLICFYTTRGGLGTWCSLCGVPFLSGYFVFLDVGPSILFFVLTLFWVLWFIYDW
jgi:hypothetical protein